MSKNTRNGGKYTGNHTTLCTLGAKICDIANALSGVEKITPGIIINGRGSGTSHKKVKIEDESPTVIKLTIRDNTCVQEVRLYVRDIQPTRTQFCRDLRNNGIEIRFRKF